MRKENKKELTVLQLKIFLGLVAFLSVFVCSAQPIDTTKYSIKVEVDTTDNNFFTRDKQWRGADGSSSIDLGGGRVAWLFSDSFICTDSSQSRSASRIIRNSIAIQKGTDLTTANLTFHWNKSGKEPQAFFHTNNKYWFWTGHGTMIKDRLIVFLMKVYHEKGGLGFAVKGWCAALILNPQDNPSDWKIQYIEGGDTYGTIAGSAAVLKDDEYLYAYGAVEPATHEVYVLRWNREEAYRGNLKNSEWWINGKWVRRTKKDPVPAPLFKGETEYSVHYDTVLKKYIQIQSFGFGEARIGLRLSDRVQGPWSDPYLFYTPEYKGVQKPFMYSAKAHPELNGQSLYITYNVNSFEFSELIQNQNIYFPKFIRLKIERK